MALYSPATYDSFHARYTLAQCQTGGRKRAETAQRNHLGLMLRKDGTINLPENYVHGRAGGLARWNKNKKEK